MSASTCPLCGRSSSSRDFCSKDGVLLLPGDVARAVGGYHLLRFHFIRKGPDETSQYWTVQKSSNQEPVLLRLFSEVKNALPLQQTLHRAKQLRQKNIHPAFPMIVEVGTFDEHPFIIYEKVNGTELSSVQRPPTYTPGEAARMMVHLLNALDSLHRFSLPVEELESTHPYRSADHEEKNFWHGRFSRSTLVMSQDDTLRFLGLGYTLLQQPKEPFTREEETWVAGLAEQQPGPSIDIYLAGCLLYELITGNKHRGFLSAMRLDPEDAWQPTANAPALPLDLRAQPAYVDYQGVPPEIEIIIRRATQISADLRYQRASDMMQDLLVYLGADASFAEMLLDEAVQFVQERAAERNYLSIAQLLAARPDLCLPSWFTQKLWDLLRDELTETLLRREQVDSIEWALWTHIPDCKWMLLSLIKRPHPEQTPPEQEDKIKIIAAQLLGYHQDVSDALIEAINSPYPTLRTAAASALARVNAAPPVTHGGNQARLVPCSQRWEAMTPMNEDESTRMCHKCQTPVIKVTALEDLKKIKGRGCAVYHPNLREHAARKALKDLYTVRAELEPPPPSPLLSPEERPPESPMTPEPSLEAVAMPGMIQFPEEEPTRESLLQKIKRFFSR